MVMGTPSIAVSSQLQGGPKLVSGTVSIANADTSGTIDLTSYFVKEIKGVVHVMIFNSSGVVAVATMDFTTTARKLALTFADPTEAATVYFTVIGF